MDKSKRTCDKDNDSGMIPEFITLVTKLYIFVEFVLITQVDKSIKGN